MVTTVRELPDDVLADVLRRLSPRGLAASRCVCKAWRDAIDARRLLRAALDLLPGSVRGVFMEYCNLYRPEFLSRPTAAAGKPPISSSLDFMPGVGVRRVLSHCNGLLLCEWYDGGGAGHHLRYAVANPATRRFARLPPASPPGREAAFVDQAACLVYDPAAAPHYEAVLIPLLPEPGAEAKLDPETLRSEWPPPSYAARVFSSATRRWREAPFVRVGEAAGTVADMEPWRRWGVPGHNAYWRGALYTHCKGDRFITRISLSQGKYQILKTPRDTRSLSSLGKSEKGVYCATSAPGFHLYNILFSKARMLHPSIHKS